MSPRSFLSAECSRLFLELIHTSSDWRIRHAVFVLFRTILTWSPKSSADPYQPSLHELWQYLSICGRLSSDAHPFIRQDACLTLCLLLPLWDHHFSKQNQNNSPAKIVNNSTERLRWYQAQEASLSVWLAEIGDTSEQVRALAWLCLNRFVGQTYILPTLSDSDPSLSPLTHSPPAPTVSLQSFTSLSFPPVLGKHLLTRLLTSISSHNIPYTSASSSSSLASTSQDKTLSALTSLRGLLTLSLPVSNFSDPIASVGLRQVVQGELITLVRVLARCLLTQAQATQATAMSHDNLYPNFSDYFSKHNEGWKDSAYTRVRELRIAHMLVEICQVLAKGIGFNVLADGWTQLCDFTQGSDFPFLSLSHSILFYI